LSPRPLTSDRLEPQRWSFSSLPPRSRACGHIPLVSQIETDGLDVSTGDLAELFAVDPEEWKAQLPQVREHLARFGDRLPDALRAQLDALESRLESG
jgi:GTP-dependent phosphoenolpyruvate carboxykinase